MTIDVVTPTAPRKWYQIWLDIWQHPGVASFQALLNEPNHESTRGFTWVAITSLVAALISAAYSSVLIHDIAPDLFGGIAYILCFIVLAPIFTILGMIISTGIYHWIARLLGGQGTWSDLVICTAAVISPSEVIAGVISLITLLIMRIPALTCIPAALSFLVGIYSIVLYVNAIKAAEKITTGKAVLVYFIPVIVIGLLALCSLVLLVPFFQTRG